MILPVNDKYRITSNRECWMIQQRRTVNKETGETAWESIKWLTSVQSAACELLDMQIRLSQAEGWAEAEKAAHTLLSELTRSITGQYLLQIDQTQPLAKAKL